MSGRGRVTLASAVATIAAAISFSAVFDGWSWLVPVVVVVAIVAGVNEAVRRLRIPSPLGPLLAAAVVLCYLTFLDARQFAVAGVFPGPTALRQLGDIAREGFTDIRRLSTPVPTHQGLVLLVVVAMAAVALVVDLLAVTMRRAALAGLPLLAVFAVCTSVAKHGVSWIAFGVATAGYLWLLLADSRDRISRWGRTLGMEQGTRITWADQDLAPSPLSALGRRIGASAIVVGVVLPMLLPGLHGGVPKHGGGGGSGSGGGHSVETLNPIVTLKSQLVTRTATPLLRYTSSDPTPAYLRLTALDEFDGTEFAPHELRAPPATPVNKGLHTPPVVGPTVNVSVKVGKLAVNWLPLPAQAEAVHVDGEWSFDPVTNTVFSARTDTQDTSYTATTVRPDPSPDDLEAVADADQNAFRDDLALPTIPNDVIDLASRITAGAKTPFDKAIAIQRFFTGGLFVYDTSVSGSDSTDALESFLIGTRRGFCQQFAAAMAVLARVEHIPARVAVGFTRGDKQKDGSWLVTSHDAHAWPELYFTGYGWLPFEPTPRGDGQAVPPSFTQPASTNGPGPKPSTEPEPTPTKSSGGSAADRKGLDTLGADGRPLTQSGAHHSNRASLWWFVLAVLALLLPVPALARAFGRSRRWHTADSTGALAHAAWAELRASAIDARATWHDGLSPRGAARALRADVPLPAAAEDALDRLVRAEERARYAADPRSTAARGLPDDVETVRTALLARCSRMTRWRARVLPASTLLALRAAGSRIADGLDAFDRAAAWLRGGLLRLVPTRS
jgi:transglutaminase-like putative cysteine protease